MKFRIRFADQLVGAFLVVALLAVAVILVLLGINQRWFARNYHFQSRFDSAGGLSVGMPIMLKGFEIGEIERITLNDDNQVDVVFSIQDTYYHKVLPNSVLELTSSPIGLGVTLNFHPGASAGSPRPEFSFIPSLDLPEGQDLVAAGLVVIPKGDDVIGSVIGKLNPILDEVRTAVGQLKRILGTVDLALQGKGGPVGDMVVDLAGTPDRLNALVENVGQRIDTISRDATVAIGTFGEVAASARETVDSLSRDLAAITGNLKTTTDGLTETRGLVTRLLDPKGSVATILNDQNALYDQIEGSLSQVQDAVAGVNRIVEQVNAFVDYLNGTRPQISGILETGRTTLEKGNDVLEAVKNNPLLRGGVPESKQQTTTLKSYRDEDF